MGSGFTKDINVFFGSVQAKSIEVISSKLIKAVTPEYYYETTVDIRVINSNDYSATLSNAIAFKHLDVMTSEDIKLSINSGHYLGGDIVKISGIIFDQYTKVYFGSNEAEVVYVNSGNILAITPLSANGIVDIKIVTSSGIEYTISEAFEFNNEKSYMNINGLSFSEGQLTGGELITVYGSRFRKNVKVYFGDNLATIKSLSDSTIVVEVPASQKSKTVDIKVVDEELDITATLSNAYTYISYDVELNEGIDTIKVGDSWIDSGINTPHNLIIVTSGTVNSQVEGTYTITYKCYGGTELVATLYRKVTVINKDIQVIIQLNEGITTLQVGDTYIEAGASCNVGKVTIDNSQVDTTQAGVYKVIYSITYLGKTYYKTRYVYVY